MREVLVILLTLICLMVSNSSMTYAQLTEDTLDDFQVMPPPNIEGKSKAVLSEAPVQPEQEKEEKSTSADDIDDLMNEDIPPGSPSPGGPEDKDHSKWIELLSVMQDPGECPEGFIPATPPLNPQLGCIPGSITADPGVQPGPDTPPGECPEGFIPATPPLNPQLGCIPESRSADPGVQPGEDETTGGENEDIGSTLSAVPVDQESSEEEEEGSSENEDEPTRGISRGISEPIIMTPP